MTATERHGATTPDAGDAGTARIEVMRTGGRLVKEDVHPSTARWSSLDGLTSATVGIFSEGDGSSERIISDVAYALACDPVPSRSDARVLQQRSQQLKRHGEDAEAEGDYRECT